MGDGLNRVILLGNLGADPELRYTAAGMPVLSLRLATNESFVDKNRDVQQRTEWHNVIVWGARAESLGRLLGKGTCLLVEGGLRTSSYEKEGAKRYKTEVHAREICITSRRAASGPADEEGSDRPPAMSQDSSGSSGPSSIGLDVTEEDMQAPARRRSGKALAGSAPSGRAAVDELPF